MYSSYQELFVFGNHMASHIILCLLFHLHEIYLLALARNTYRSTLDTHHGKSLLEIHLQIFTIVI